MIKHELAPVPAGEAHHRRREGREGEAVRQDRGGIDKAQTPVGSPDRNQRHRRHGMRPACFKKPDPAYKQQLTSAGDACGHTAPEGYAGRPESDPHPEGVSRPPIEYIDAEGRDHECDREMHHHHVNRVPNQGHGRTDIESKQFQLDLTPGQRLEIVLLCHRPPPSRRLQHPSSRHRSLLYALIQVGMLAVLPGCNGPLSTLDPSGPAGASIATLWWLMLIGAGILFALVMVLFAMVIRRPGWGSNVSPGRWIVLGGLVLPAVVLLPLVAYALIAGERLLPLPGLTPPRIEAVGRQWVWTFRYPDHDGVETRNVLHLPAGAPVDILVTSQDVIHAFWIPRFAGKIDAVPEHVNRLRIQADQPGHYAGQCNDFCGLGHAVMRFDVIVHRPEDFSAALARAASGESERK